MDKILYYAPRGVAIILASAMTIYGAWLSWCHFSSILGPLVAVSASALLVLAERAWRHGWPRGLLLGILGVAAAVFSATVVVDRIVSADQARMQGVRDANHPRAVAQRALDDARADLKAAEADAKAECITGRKGRCKELERREEAARQRIDGARAKVTSTGASAVEDPAAEVFGAWASTYRTALPLALPVWLEITAPILMAYGLAPGPRKAPQSPAQSEGDCARNQPRKPRRKAAKAKPGTRAYWIARLDRDRPDLARLVRNGSMSANMAAIKAGFRKADLKLVAANDR